MDQRDAFIVYSREDLVLKICNVFKSTESIMTSFYYRVNLCHINLGFKTVCFQVEMEEVEQPTVEKQPESEKPKDDEDDLDEEDLVCSWNDLIRMNEKLL